MDRVSEAVMGKGMGVREKRKGGQHGSAVVVVYLGHGELEETHGRLGSCGDGVALQAVLERGGVRGGEVVARCGGEEGHGDVL